MNWKIFFYAFFTNKEIFFEFIFIIDETIFKDIIFINIFKIVKRFVTKYKRQPDIDMMYVLLDKLPDNEQDNKKMYIEFLNSIKVMNLKIDAEVIKDEVYRCIQIYDMERFILRSANKIGSLNFEDMLTDIRNIVIKYKPQSSGIKVSDSEKIILLIRNDTSEKISSGIASLDSLLYGGYGTNEISVVVAPPGRGKSFYLINAMYGALLNQKNVLYITFELTEKSVLKRLYSRISYSSRKEMLEETQVKKAVDKFFALSKSDGKVIYYPSKSITVEGIETILEKQAMYFNFVPHILIVDYLDLIFPRNIDTRLEVRHRLRNITDDLRSLSLRRNIAIITATQANRESLAKNKVTEVHVSESFGKIEVSDIVIAICQTEEEKQINRARLSLLKNRDYISGGCVEVYIDFEKMLLLDLETAKKMNFI